MFVSKEIKAVFTALDEIGEFNDLLFYNDVKQQVGKILIKNNRDFTSIIKRDGIIPIRTAYSMINNVSGDMLETGRYHFYRGSLGSIGIQLLKMYDISTDKLIEYGEMDSKQATKHKEEMRKIIKSIG
jgi:hypothetical protein